MADCESVNPYGPGEKSSQVRRMFDAIAPSYDRINRLMTLGIDRLWRRRLLKRLEPLQPRSVLDVATGTADLAMLAARRLTPIEVIGVDPSLGMLAIGRDKVAREGLADVVTLEEGDAMQLPFTDARFDCVTAAYGVRNFPDLLRGLREMCRVLRPGGMLAVLELSTPTGKITRPLHHFYAHRVIPTAGRLISHDKRAYTYLPESVDTVPQGEEMARLLVEAGFKSVDWRPYTFGACTAYFARK